MRFTINNCCSVLLLCVLVARGAVQGQQRISQTKCQEYRQWMPSNKMNCNRPESLILLPDPIREGDYPHQALIGWKRDEDSRASNTKYEFIRSGSLISEQYILTVAHVTRFDQKQPEVVRLGMVDLHSEDDRHVDYEIAEVIRHPNFTARYAYHDIALIRLKEPVSFSKIIRPACLWDSMQMNFTSVEVTGFGFADSTSSSLRKFKLDVKNASVCEAIFGRSRKFRDGVTDQQLCLAGTDLERDTCHGLSGSPAQITLNPEDCVAHIVSLVSYGTDCAGGPSLEVQTRVASYIDWIEGIVWA